jgi:Zn-dependent oligopeptidase
MDNVRREMTQKMQRFEDHMLRAQKGWDLIYDMRQDIAVIKEQMATHLRDLNSRTDQSMQR